MCKNKRQETHPTIHDPAKAHKSPHLYNFILTGEQVYSISAWQKHGQKTPPLFFHFTLRFLCTCNSMPRQHVFKTQSSQPHNRTTRHLHAQSTLCLAGKKTQATLSNSVPLYDLQRFAGTRRNKCKRSCASLASTHLTICNCKNPGLQLHSCLSRSAINYIYIEVHINAPL